MKLSVCIPVFNFDVRRLVSDLAQEISRKKIDAEIILIDDASEDYFQEKNSEITPRVNSYIFLQENIGRSAIRNMFLRYASGEWLLFLDCDAGIVSENFLSKYLEFFAQNPEATAVYGGFSEDGAQRTLRNYYSAKREVPALAARRKHPHTSLKGINFAIRRDVFAKINFDERISTYGYEDWMLGYSLAKNEFPVDHIENPVLHLDKTTDAEFLKKTECSMRTLARLLKDKQYADAISGMKIAKAYRLLSNLHLAKHFSELFNVFEKPVKRLLLSGNYFIPLLDFYKILLLCSLMEQDMD
ncbi:Glycosyltransferase, GT2 family [Cruoricaptor ignavus]|uniref:Glycosyltransferase, GT2 family n=1 Tax=Cruoricaptor ignavus TaxID=1118202 RepID=A0A1M6FMR7_9FLAO|nr:glycosyltransferase family 2 protein [Cruoricaptor ignavus]SHI99048.1 Glycosyltransferase, GT2 family [Cruoricaptor ignavus]